MSWSYHSRTLDSASQNARLSHLRAQPVRPGSEGEFGSCRSSRGQSSGTQHHRTVAAPDVGQLSRPPPTDPAAQTRQTVAGPDWMGVTGDTRLRRCQKSRLLSPPEPHSVPKPRLRTHLHTCTPALPHRGPEPPSGRWGQHPLSAASHAGTRALPPSRFRPTCNSHTLERPPPGSESVKTPLPRQVCGVLGSARQSLSGRRARVLGAVPRLEGRAPAAFSTDSTARRARPERADLGDGRGSPCVRETWGSSEESTGGGGGTPWRETWGREPEWRVA